MSKYEGMSYFEINKAVVVALNFGRVFAMFTDDESQSVYMDPMSEDKFDPCSNPADMWPLIVEYGICLTSPTAGRRLKRWSASWDEDGGKWASGGIVYSHENPLRAAAIVFLMMMDAKNESN